MKQQSITQDIILTFLKDVYFRNWRKEEGKKDDYAAYRAAGGRAYRDFCRTIQGMRKDNKKKELKNIIYIEIFTSLEKAAPKTQKDFDEWHHNMCEQIIEKYRTTAKLNYGQAQKWLNMAMKYAIVLEIPQAMAVISFMHVPVDNIVLGLLENEVKPSSADPWSQWEYNTYFKFQKDLRDHLKGKQAPIVWEFTHWH
ncbi:MAG: hypothetical protein KBS40_02605 [Bacteroidales bacterium]|nr:hypothetical protein [Bacteroidales bacterium]